MKKIIDIHQHFYAKPDDKEDWAKTADTMVESYQEHNIVKVCISACGPHYDQPGNEAVELAFKRHPDTIIGMAHLDVDKDSPDDIQKYHDSGFTGLKVINPLKPYNHDFYLPLFEKAAELGMPTLFHTGTVARMTSDSEYDTDSSRMMPILLDRIARKFPELTIIGAHLGGPWYDEACSVMDANPNVYFDLSGAVGFFCKVSPAYFVSLAWWRKKVWEKLAFGIDGSYEFIGKNLEKNEIFLNDIVKFPDDLQEKFYYGNAAEILKLG